MELTKKLAHATWIVILVYIFANRFVGLVIGRTLADLLVFFLAVAGLLASIYCLVRMRTYGRKGILAPALAGLLINVLILCIWIPNFLAARARSSEVREPTAIVNVHVKSDGTILMDDRPVTLEQAKGEFKRLASTGGAIKYSRDNPTGDPPPNAMDVIAAAADAELQILMEAP